MSIDFSRTKVGDTVQAFCCDGCARNNGLTPKRPADSGVESWLCDLCGHYGIGSTLSCEVGNWLILQPNVELTGAAPHGQQTKPQEAEK